MRLVIDANRVISALLRDGATRESMLRTSATLFAPDDLQVEVMRHLPELAKRVGVKEEQLALILTTLLKRIVWVSEAEYRPHLARAKRAMARIDPKDVAYLACALAVGADAIWSHDADFDRQALVPRVSHPDQRAR